MENRQISSFDLLTKERITFQADDRLTLNSAYKTLPDGRVFYFTDDQRAFVLDFKSG
jgi:hypothetical protein